MTVRTRYAVFVSLTSAAIALAAVAAHADATPVINTFSATPQTLNSHNMLSLDWSGDSSTGEDILIPCMDGVYITWNGDSAFPCNTRQQVSQTTSGSLQLTAINVSGAAQTITATIFPKDAAGSDYDSGSKSATFTVQTAPQPITDVSISQQTIDTGGSIRISWTGVDIPAANVQFDCVSGIQITATEPSTLSLPCGRTAFTSDLDKSGAIVVTAANTRIPPEDLLVTARVVPALAAGMYDATHSRTVLFTVKAKAQASDSSTSLFAASSSQVSAGTPFGLTWQTSNTSGANLQFQCVPNLQFFSYANATSTAIPCNTLAFTSPLAANGSATFVATSSSNETLSFSVSILPQASDGSYMSPQGKTLSIFVLPPPVAVAQTPVAVITATTSAVANTTSVPTPASASTKNRFVFTLPLQKGSRNKEVTNLQTFLAQNPAIYPEGLVTGYYGNASGLAVQRLQLKYGISKKGDSGYGVVGPKTRALLNVLLTP